MSFILHEPRLTGLVRPYRPFILPEHIFPRSRQGPGAGLIYPWRILS